MFLDAYGVSIDELNEIVAKTEEKTGREYS